MTDLSEVKVNLQITKYDILWLAVAGFIGSVPKVVSFIFSLALPFLVLYLRSITKINTLILLLSIVPIVLHLNMLFRILPKNARADYEGGSYFKRTPLFSVDKNSVHIEKSTGSTSDITLDNLRSIWETPGYFYFSITKNNTIILPKRQLENAQKKFVHSVKMSMPRKKRRNPQNPSLGNLILSAFTTFVAFAGLIFAITSVLGLFSR